MWNTYFIVFLNFIYFINTYINKNLMNEEQKYQNLLIHQRFFCFNQIVGFIVLGIYLWKQLELLIFTIVNKGEVIIPYCY